CGPALDGERLQKSRAAGTVPGTGATGAGNEPPGHPRNSLPSLSFDLPPEVFKYHVLDGAPQQATLLRPRNTLAPDLPPGRRAQINRGTIGRRFLAQGPLSETAGSWYRRNLNLP